eukprot:SAG31_NODE_831_length_11669_cov_3.410026_12_plen_61_part_00
MSARAVSRVHGRRKSGVNLVVEGIEVVSRVHTGYTDILNLISARWLQRRFRTCGPAHLES